MPLAVKYKPGEFYKRELPAIVRLLKINKLCPNTIIVDGHVYLDGINRPGLGKHLYDLFEGAINVVGVAKNPFRDSPDEFRVFRGNSRSPLYVSSVGIELNQAKALVESMHGEYRIPTLLKLVDRLCRHPNDQ